MKQIRLISATLFVTAAFTSCIDKSMGLFEEPHTTYVMEDGKKLECGKIKLNDGREYYLAAIDSVNYQQAVNMQKEGWVLPRMHGISSMDEHRYSSNWIKMEEIIGASICDPSADLTDVDMNFCVSGSKFRLLGTGSKLREGKTIFDYWTDTRYLSPMGYHTYGLCYEQTLGGDSIDLYSTYFYPTFPDICHGAILLKDAYLVENNIPDSVYTLPDNKKQVPGKRIHGADGYDYWTVMPVADTLVTWKKAMEYEKDGWMLARFEGRRFGYQSYKFREWEAKTIHAEGFHLTAEGLCGRHPLRTEYGIVDNFDDAMPAFEYITDTWDVAGYWLGTPVGNSAGTILHRNNVMQSTQNKNMPLERVALFKRIQPSAEDAKYRYILPDGNYAQARKVVGKSGSVYYVVDPSGWQGLDYKVNELSSLEKDGYHVLQLDELSDMLGENLYGGCKLPDFQHPLFKSLFPEDVMQHVKGVNGEPMWFWPAVKVYSYIEKELEVIPHPYSRPINVRLVKKAM